ncbi:kinase-like domain-containing protein [Rhizophagus irregularis DAOM 181602=DAOM 197198]|nr:kinase-like domain-containing protein [Rhizophagus irregularis DAOM 181602=DAOM 197198]
MKLNTVINANNHILITSGGFGEIHRAIWSDGPIYSWNSDEQQWNRQAEYKVALKILKGSSSSNNKFLDEWKYHYNYLMKKCWDSNPSDRPTIVMIENILSKWIKCINEHYEINRDENNTTMLTKYSDDQLKNNMLEFVEANKVNVQEQANSSNIQSHPQSHPQTYYTSREFSEILVQEGSDESQCWDEFKI